MTSIASFIKKFQLLMDKHKCNGDIVYFRSGISSEEEAFEFIKTFSTLTGTDWVIHHGRPHSQKFIFFKTWLCHRSWNKKSEFSNPDDNCNAKIDIRLKNTSLSTAKNDIHLNHHPPLHCIIRLSGKHNHNSNSDDGLQMVGLTEELKEKFFTYFQSGLTAAEAKMAHEILIQTMKRDKKIIKGIYNLTSRQVHQLYNYWMNLKDTVGFSKENTDTMQKVTFKELLNAIPKIELSQDSKKVPTGVCAESPPNKELQLPLVFVSTDPPGNSPLAEGQLLYKLKYGLQETFVSRLTVPQVSILRIDSLVQSCSNSQVLKPTSISEVSIKSEPPDLDEEADSSLTSGNFQNTSQMPIICKADNSPENTSLNLDLAGDATVADRCIFPLVFASTGLTCSEYEEDAPLLYSLKQGPFGLCMNQLITSQILSVHVHSTSRVTLFIKSATSYTEATYDVHNQVEHIKREVIVENPNPLDSEMVDHPLSMPVILDVSSCNKRKIDDVTATCIPNGRKLPVLRPSSKKPEAASSKLPELKDDEDYQFLMSLLPELKQLPQEQKKHVKKKMQEFVITSRLCASRIQFEKSRFNIYRDCRVLPSLRDWKF